MRVGCRALEARPPTRAAPFLLVPLHAKALPRSPIPVLRELPAGAK
jgi:hypothetical protein